MSLGINVDWSKNYNEDTGEQIYDLSCPNREHHEKYGTGWHTEYNCTELDGEKIEAYQGCPTCEDDSGYLEPMMNYVYPLDYDGMVTEEKRIKITTETSCILVENNETGEWVIALTGGGMDLSPQIAYAFFIAQKWLPLDLIRDLKSGWCKDSLSEEKFKELWTVVKDQLKMEKSRFAEALKNWDRPIKEISQ